MTLSVILKSKKFIVLFSFAFALAVLIFLALYRQGYVDFKRIFPSESYTVFLSCQKHMKHNVCAIMTTNMSISKEVQQIYLPSIGPIKADIYRDLLSSGFQMCDVIYNHCDKNLNSEVCEIGKILYPKIN